MSVSLVPASARTVKLTIVYASGVLRLLCPFRYEIRITEESHSRRGELWSAAPGVRLRVQREDGYGRDCQ